MTSESWWQNDSLTDQSFPPFIPANISESCPAVLRVEDGKLSDLNMLFLDVFRAHVNQAGRLPHGSVIMVGSFSHLSLPGLASCTKELVRVIRTEASPSQPDRVSLLFLSSISS